MLPMNPLIKIRFYLYLFLEKSSAFRQGQKPVLTYKTKTQIHYQASETILNDLLEIFICLCLART